MFGTEWGQGSSQTAQELEQEELFGEVPLSSKALVCSGVTLKPDQ